MKSPFEETPEIKKRVAIYVRVSTEEQSEHGHGLEVQKDILKKHCEQLNYSLDEEKHIFVDPGLSGSLPINKRPALAKLFEAAERKEFDIVIVYRLDRFFRSLKHLLNAVERLGELKIKFRSATENFENETMNGELMFHLIASFAHHERRLIAERMSGGRAKSAKNGQWVTGVPPYGYRVNTEKKLEIMPEEAENVKLFYHWLVYEKCSLREIIKKANDRCLTPPTHKKPKKSGMPNCWWKRTMNRILLNEIYTGDFYFRKHFRPFKYLDALDEQNQRPKEDWISITVPQIISKELFEMSIQQLRKNRENAKRNTKRPYMYSKLLYCGYTGHKLQSGFQTPLVHKKSPTLGKYYHTYVRESAYTK